MKKILLSFVALFVLGATTITLSAQAYKFTDVVKVPATPVKNQASTGTCWSFAAAGFIECELLRLGKGEHDISEMFVVRNNYIKRMEDNYLRRGKGNLGQGSLAHMFTNVIRDNGMIPEEAYPGINYDSKTHNHRELNKFVTALSGAAVDLKDRSPQYYILLNHLLDTYLGKVPEKFTYRGKEYTPKSFVTAMGLNIDDYVEITSLSHIPFYKESVIEVPDNWDFGRFWNVPLDEFMTIIDNALTTGYSVAWDGDVSEKGFSFVNGVAINPEPKDLNEATKFEKTYPEVVVSQQVRQAGYENFTTTDDHLMLLTGIVKDQNGTKYYVTKNSWGPDRNKFGGYLNMSESYVRAKTISIMVHKDAVPKDIRKKLNF